MRLGFLASHQGSDLQAILDALTRHDVELVVLAGYMKKLGPRTLTRYRGRVLNIHPALLPRFGGQGMYGARVHEAVLASGERETGVTIHVVDEEYDHGPIVAQCRVPVLAADTPETLAARVLERVETLERIVSGASNLGRLSARHSRSVPGPPGRGALGG